MLQHKFDKSVEFSSQSACNCIKNYLMRASIAQFPSAIGCKKLSSLKECRENVHDFSAHLCHVDKKEAN